MVRLVSSIGAGLALLLSLSAAASAQDLRQPPEFRSGLTAFNLGHYADAYRQWEPLATAGNADAESGMGYLYYKGLGVPQDYAAAVDWFSRAAEKGQPEAQLFLGTFFYNGIGVGRSYVQAYKWCDLALSNGASQAGPCREAAQQRMSAAEVDESTRLVTEWFTQHKR